MMKRILLVAALAVACTPTPRPAILDEVARMRDSGSATEAARLAPQAALHAAKVEGEAETALKDGDRVGAEALAEEALAAYAHAEALARLAKADERSESASSHVVQVQTEFATLEAQQHQVAAEADDAEARFKVARDAVPLATTEPGTPEREHARLAAAKALSVEARLLCVAAQMLAPDTQGVADDFKALDAVDAALATSHPAIDTAVRLRSACLGELTSVRRGATADAPERGGADALLDELGKAGLSPSRDDRGVFVALRDAFQGDTLRPDAHERVVALGQVAHAHAAFPVLVVSHTKGAHDANRVDAIVKALTEAGAPKVRATGAGDALPLSPLGRPGASASNDRIEIVFIAPSN